MITESKDYVALNVTWNDQPRCRILLRLPIGSAEVAGMGKDWSWLPWLVLD